MTIKKKKYTKALTSRMFLLPKRILYLTYLIYAQMYIIFS